jgi:biopolymer transport protein ExbB
MKNMHIDGVFRTLVGVGSIWVLWLLVGLSVLAVTVMLERLVFFYRTGDDTATLRARLRAGLVSGELVLIEQLLAGSRSVEARIVSAGLRATCPAEAEERMAAEAQAQRLRLEQSLAFLGTLGTNAPFVGLLGTVIGIVGAFQQLDIAGGQLTAGLMTVIGEALIATAVGLMVALPAIAAYNAFQRTIQVRLSRGDVLGREVTAHLHGLAQQTAPTSIRNVARPEAAE